MEKYKRGIRTFDEIYEDLCDKEIFCKPQTDLERKYGYSWGFLVIIKKELNLSYRDLEGLVDIKKDTLNKYMKNDIERVKLEFDLLGIKNRQKEIEDKLKKLPI